MFTPQNTYFTLQQQKLDSFVILVQVVVVPTKADAETKKDVEKND